MHAACSTDTRCAGLAITLEHNFMMSASGMQNFESQIKQVVQSIQTTNDLDVHQALLTAPSYQNKVREGYYVDQYIHKALQDYKDNFGFVQVRAPACAFGAVCVCCVQCFAQLTARARAEKHERAGYYYRGHQGAHARVGRLGARLYALQLQAVLPAHDDAGAHRVLHPGT